MNFSAELADLRKWVENKLTLHTATLFGWTLTAKSSEMGDTDQAETADGEKGQRPVRRIEPWGHRGRAPSKIRSFWIRLGSSNVLFVGIAPSKGYGPNDLEEGETAIYSAKNPEVVRAKSDGTTAITSSNSKPLTLNGDGHPLPKFDTYEAAEKTFLAALDTLLNSGMVVAGAAASFSPANLATFEAAKTVFFNGLSGHTYESTDVKND
jgi:hypothetical protein